MERVLITGANGFIGKELIRQGVSEPDLELIALSRTPITDEEILRSKREGKLRILQGDMEDAGLLRKELPFINTVVHLAWESVPTSDSQEPQEDIRSNVLPSLSMLESALEKGMKRFIFLSSGGAVYGHPRYLPIDEFHPEFPISSYGISKLMFEKHLFYYQHKHRIEPFIFRPSTVYGPIQEGERDQGVVAIWIDRVLRGLPIQQWGDGSQVKDLLFVDDLIEGIFQGIRSDNDGGLWNLGSGIGVELSKVRKELEKLHGAPIHPEEKPFKGTDVSKNILSIEKAARELHWKPRTSLEEGIQRTWKNMKKALGTG